MTTNIERAEELILRNNARRYPFSGPAGTAQALADDNLIMLDLPEPEMENGQKVWRVDKDGFVYIDAHGQIATVGVKTPYGSPAIALRHALAIIAAANHKQEQGNE